MKKTADLSFSIIFVIGLLLPNIATAQTIVAVIPMAGDSVMPAPFAPLTKNAPPDSDYTINNANTVVDNITGLEWQRVDDNITKNWSDAFQYCINLTLDSKNDWRLPLRNELQSIVDYSISQPSINADAFPSTNGALYWSASSYAIDVSRMWVVVFTDGDVYTFGKTHTHFVRCVR